MSITTLTSREFGQDTDRARKAATEGPVFITDHDEPAHVLLSIADYRRLTGRRRSAAEALSMGADDDIEFDPPKIALKLQDVDFS